MDKPMNYIDAKIIYKKSRPKNTGHIFWLKFYQLANNNNGKQYIFSWPEVKKMLASE